MRFALLATASTLLVGFATFACSGTASEDTGAADSGASTTVADQTSTTTGAAAAATTTTVTSTLDAGDIDASITATNDGDAGAACAAASIHETEANDTTANVVPATTGSFCGRITAGDTDKISFVMPTTISSFAAGFDQLIGSGRLNVAADVNGQSFNFFGRWPFVAGGTYTFTLTGTIPDGAELDYNLNLSFTP